MFGADAGYVGEAQKLRRLDADAETARPPQNAAEWGVFFGKSPVARECVVGPGDGVSGLVAAVSGPLGGCASD
jgi:hypothetical protein